MSDRGKSQMSGVAILYRYKGKILRWLMTAMKILLPQLKKDGICANRRYNLSEKQVHAALQRE